MQGCKAVLLEKEIRLNFFSELNSSKKQSNGYMKMITR